MDETFHINIYKTRNFEPNFLRRISFPPHLAIEYASTPHLPLTLYPHGSSDCETSGAAEALHEPLRHERFMAYTNLSLHALPQNRHDHAAKIDAQFWVCLELSICSQFLCFTPVFLFSYVFCHVLRLFKLFLELIFCLKSSKKKIPVFGSCF